MGIDKIINFPFPTAPDNDALQVGWGDRVRTFPKWFLSYDNICRKCPIKARGGAGRGRAVEKLLLWCSGSDKFKPLIRPPPSSNIMIQDSGSVMVTSSQAWVIAAEYISASSSLPLADHLGKAGKFAESNYTIIAIEFASRYSVNRGNR